MLVLQRSHARAHDDPLNKPNVQTTKNLRENKSTGAELPSSLPPPSLLPDPPVYIATTGSATARHVSSLPAPPPLRLLPHTVRLPGGRGACAFSGRFLRRRPSGRADVAVPAALLPAAARWARRDLRQHPRCVRFLGPVLGNLAILAGCVCANLLARAVALGLLDLFVGGFLEVTRPAAPTTVPIRVTRTLLFSLYSPFLEGEITNKKKVRSC